MQIWLKRAYERPGPQDGTRVLVDRVWPRGLSKADAGIDLWLKEVVPSSALRKWFNHDPDKWEAFKRRYFRELDTRAGEAVKRLSDLAEKGRVTLVFASKNENLNNASALKAYLKAKSKEQHPE